MYKSCWRILSKTIKPFLLKNIRIFITRPEIYKATHVQIQKEVIKSATILKINGVWIVGNTIGHRRICKTLDEQCKLFLQSTDYEVANVKFGRRCTVRFHSRKQWTNPESLVGSFDQFFYTDGSKIYHGTGCGWILDNQNKYTAAMGEMMTVFPMEILAILEVACCVTEIGQGRALESVVIARLHLRPLKIPGITQGWYESVRID